MVRLRVVTLSILMLAAAFSAIAVAPTPAAAVGCSGTGCNGQDPGTTGCSSGSYTVYSVSKQFYASGNFWATLRVDLRWSPTCKTNWARGVITSSNPSNSSFQIQVYLQQVAAGGGYGTLWDTEYTGIGRQVYGDMWYAPTQPLRACGHVNNFSGPSVCTALG